MRNIRARPVAHSQPKETVQIRGMTVHANGEDELQPGKIREIIWQVGVTTVVSA
jgi:hypothetical protein